MASQYDAEEHEHCACANACWVGVEEMAGPYSSETAESLWLVGRVRGRWAAADPALLDQHVDQPLDREVVPRLLVQEVLRPGGRALSRARPNPWRRGSCGLVAGTPWQAMAGDGRRWHVMACGWHADGTRARHLVEVAERLGTAAQEARLHLHDPGRHTSHSANSVAIQPGQGWCNIVLLSIDSGNLEALVGDSAAIRLHV